MEILSKSKLIVLAIIIIRLFVLRYAFLAKTLFCYGSKLLDLTYGFSFKKH
jgi:hypothetical protein